MFSFFLDKVTSYRLISGQYWYEDRSSFLNSFQYKQKGITIGMFSPIQTQIYPPPRYPETIPLLLLLLLLQLLLLLPTTTIVKNRPKKSWTLLLFSCVVVLDYVVQIVATMILSLFAWINAWSTWENDSVTWAGLIYFSPNFLKLFSRS